MDLTGFYLNEDGSVMKNQWHQINNDQWYYVDEDGNRVTDSWLEIDGNRYYFDEDGVTTRIPDQIVHQ